MIHPDGELRFISQKIGFGVVATRLIPRGSITWVQDRLDRVFTPEQVSALGPMYADMLHKYSYMNVDGDYVLCWDLARYVNHSCSPSCLSAGYNFEIAVRDIHPGEELTDDYASLNLTGSFECCCGTGACRGTVRAEDAVVYADRWDAIMGEAFPPIAQVDQPLWPLVNGKEIEDALAGRAPVASCRLNLRSFAQGVMAASGQSGS